MADVIKFPPTFGDLLREVDEERRIKGKVTVDEKKFSGYMNALKILSQYMDCHDGIQIDGDDPREHFDHHILNINFDVSNFENGEVETFADMIRPFDLIDFASDENGNLALLLYMEGIYKAE